MSLAPESAVFVDELQTAPPRTEPWPTLLVRREELAAQAERLAELPWPEGGRRRTLIVHPMSPPEAPGFTPGVRVALEVLRPGERSSVARHLGGVIGFSIAGSGQALVGDRSLPFDRYDVWSIPSWAPYAHINTGDELQVRLMYSFDPLLERLHVPLTGDADLSTVTFDDSPRPRQRDPLADEVLQLSDPAASVRGYEALVDPLGAPQTPALWTFEEARRWLAPQQQFGERYSGRMIALLVHQSNERTMGTIPVLNAMYGTIPAGASHVPHRHTATSVVYHFGGPGHSVIGGRRVEWRGGDLMLGAPGLAVHFHACGPEPDWAMVVQDNALQLAMDTEMWQEDLRGPAILIGSHQGYQTNRGALQSSAGGDRAIAAADA